VRVLLKRVVDARVRRGSAPVVVDAQTAADVDVRDVEAHAAELHVKARYFLESKLDEPDIRDLRTEVEVNEFENVEPASAAQLVDEGDEVRRVEPEFRLLAPALLPAAEAAAGELDAHAGGRRHSQLVGDFEQHVDLR